MEQVVSREFLRGCLLRAKIDEDFVDGIVEACEINQINAFKLAYGRVDVAGVARRLFLTEDEVRDFVTGCKDMCAEAGVFPQANGVARDEPAACSVSIDRRDSGLKRQEELTSSSLTGLPDVRKQSPTEAWGCPTPNLPTHDSEDPPQSFTPVSEAQDRAPNRPVRAWLYDNPPIDVGEVGAAVPGNNMSFFGQRVEPPKRHVKSFMRATASSKARAQPSSGTEQGARAQHPASVESSLCEAKTVSARLLKPTQASKMRSRNAVNLDVQHDESGRPLTTEEIKFLQAVEEGKRIKRALRSPQHHSAGSASPSASSAQSQQSRLTEPRPFRLRSVARHERAVQQFKQRILNEHEEEEAARKFKAGRCKVSQTFAVHGAAKQATVAKTPRLQSAKRAEHWEKNIKPKKDRMEKVYKRLDEQKRMHEEVSMARTIMFARQTLVHQARPMPDFSKVFKPDLSSRPPPTRAVSPKLATARRKGDISIEDTAMDIGGFRPKAYGSYNVADSYTAMLKA